MCPCYLTHRGMTISTHAVLYEGAKNDWYQEEKWLHSLFLPSFTFFFPFISQQAIYSGTALLIPFCYVFTLCNQLSCFLFFSESIRKVLDKQAVKFVRTIKQDTRSGKLEDRILVRDTNTVSPPPVTPGHLKEIVTVLKIKGASRTCEVLNMEKGATGSTQTKWEPMGANCDRLEEAREVTDYTS